ncbi:hypothetical protein TUM4438_28420 [Shewanella sairae]|uniref:DUF2987 domain-containing protein n=1 Tax=Shewanella sairae TaxID=190310 RepID=A0ABQ4PJR0_9GAMM|nr:DUF2987 domain-containing protein [Shewanella sairae]MCL1129895.1 DUF2987 domain-containing protein [Shewanella sairae]GIU47996.1 hypothetical protein TUM4438_28420 [Shewanella sairae]
MKKQLLFSCILLGLAGASQAAPISLEYQGFYQRLKQVNKGNYQLVELAFSVSKANGCKVNSGTITTEKDSFPLTITKDQRLFLPYDGQLKSDRALINLDVEGNAETCAIAMQVRAKNTKQSYSQAELVQIADEMNALLSQMQGFPMRLFASDIAGLNLEFGTEATVTIDGKVIPVDGTYRVESSQLHKLTSLTTSIAPKVISPWTSK